MSRSHKKHPFNTDYSRTVTKWHKRMANKAVRRYKYYLPKGKLYRRIYNPWNIHDFVEYETEMMAREWFRHNQEYINRFNLSYKDLDEDAYINKMYKKYLYRK